MDSMQRNGTRISGFWLAGLLALSLLVTGMGQVFCFVPIARADDPPPPPTVSKTVPDINESGVLVNTNIEVTFSVPMNTAATQNAFSLAGVSGLFRWETDNKTMTFDPTDYLDGGTAYTATISTNATSMAGVRMESDKVWSFTTADVISVTITDNPPDGLNFGSHDPGGDNKYPEAASPSPSITIENKGTVSVNISIKGDNFTGAGTIPILNAFWNTSNDPDGATPMTTDYASVTTLAAGDNVSIYHWLSIPNETPAGSYNSTFTYKAEEVL